MKMSYLLAAFFLWGCGRHPSSPDIRIDGRFADWTGIPPVYSDPAGDSPGIDIGRVWMTNDTRRLFIRFEVGEEISLQTANNLGALIDLPDEKYPRDIFVVNVHLPFGANDAGRRQEAEEIIRLVMGARAGDDSLPLPVGTPIVIIGDMNLVGDSRQLATLLGGPGAEGGGVAAGPGPDWDGTALTDLLPYHSGAPESYTWMSSERSGFGPGRLDLVIYTDSVLQSVKSYILCTETMGGKELERYGLRREDGPVLSDHCPVVVDFMIR